MRRLSRIADRAIGDALHHASVGTTELEIAASLTRSVFEQGAENFKLMIVATGERSVFPNVGLRSVGYNRGISVASRFLDDDGYHAGVCRTARVGPAAYAEAIWRNLVECKYLALEMMKPGASSHAIYLSFIRHLSKMNLPAISFLGHGIGLHLHEVPYLGRYSDVPLEAGMVLGFEPLVYDTGYGFGMQNKDVVAVTERGHSLLSDVTDTDQLIAIQ